MPINNIYYFLGYSYGYLSHDLTIRDKSVEIDCNELERVFVKNNRFEIKTKGSYVQSNDFDDLDISATKDLSSFSLSLTTKKDLTVTTSSSTTPLTTTKQNEIVSQISSETESNLNLLALPSSYVSSTTSDIISKSVNEIKSFETSSNLKINSNYILREIKHFLYNFINDLNDYVYIAYSVILKCIIVYLYRFSIKNNWNEFNKKRKQKKFAKRILKQKKIDDAVRAYTNRLDNNDIFVIQNEPITHENESVRIPMEYPNAPVASSFLPLNNTDNPPAYDHQPVKCECTSKCKTTNCPCLNNKRSCSQYCHTNKKSHICENKSRF